MKQFTYTLFITLVLLLCTSPAGADTNDSPAEGIEALLGTYAFETQLYMNPLSSFIAWDGFEEYYTFGERSLVITDFEGRRRGMEASYQQAPADAQAFRESFMLEEPTLPELSSYETRMQYTITDAANPDRFYRLYQLDGELWFAQLVRMDMDGITHEYFWSIYKIKPFQSPLPLMTSLYGKKDGVDAFLTLQTDFSSSYDNDECFNITADTLRFDSGYSVFKYNQSCASFLLYDGEIYPMGDWYGGCGVTSMAQADLNQDGVFELFFTYSFGSGLHRASAACFDPALKAIVPLKVSDPNSDPQAVRVLGPSIRNDEMIVATNLQGGLSLYSAAVASMKSFVEMVFQGTGRLYDIAGMGDPEH